MTTDDTHLLHLNCNMGIYLEILTYLYALSKEIIDIVFARKSTNYPISVAEVLLTIIFFVIGLSVFLPWLTFKSILYILLKCVFKDHFGGFLDMDSFMESLKVDLTEVYIVDHNGSSEELFDNVKHACQHLYDSHFKFSSIVEKSCGFYYFVKNKVSIDNIITVVDCDCSTRRRLLDYLENNNLNELGVSKLKLWDVKVFEKPIVWGNDNRTYYPVVIRYNHCLADAVCLSVFRNKYLLNEVIREGFKNAIEKSKRSKEVLNQSAIASLGIKISKLNTSYFQSHTGRTARLAVYMEEKPHYFEMTKTLSKHFNCTFTDILMISSALSILDYLKTQNISLKEILTVNTCRPITENISAVLNAEIFRNDVTFDFFCLPCGGDDHFNFKFKKYIEILKEGRRNCNSQSLYIGRQLLTYLPSFVTKYAHTTVSSRICIALTNIPGVDFAKIRNNVIKDFFMFSNHSGGGKLVLFINTYGGKLQLLLLSRKDLIITREDLQTILRDTLKNIDKLWEIYNGERASN